MNDEHERRLSRFTTYNDQGFGWRWKLVDSSGEVVALSGRAWDSEKDAFLSTKKLTFHIEGAMMKPEPKREPRRNP